MVPCSRGISAIPGSDCVDPGGDQCYQVPSRFVSVDSGRQAAMHADPFKLLPLLAQVPVYDAGHNRIA